VKQAFFLPERGFMLIIPIVLFAAGVLIAGSECAPPVWPWANLAGAVLLCLAAWSAQLLTGR
jgi:hypothetical protein